MIFRSFLLPGISRKEEAEQESEARRRGCRYLLPEHQISGADSCSVFRRRAKTIRIYEDRCSQTGQKAAFQAEHRGDQASENAGG